MSLAKHIKEHLMLGFANMAGDNLVVGEGGFSTIGDVITYINLLPKTTVIFDTAVTACDADFTINSKQVTFSSASMASDTVAFDLADDTATRVTGDFIADGFTVGMSVQFTGTANQIGRVYVVTDVAVKVLTFEDGVATEAGVSCTAIGSPLSSVNYDLDGEFYLTEGTRYIPIKLTNGVNATMYTDWVDTTDTKTTWTLVRPIYHNVILTEKEYDLTALTSISLFTNWYSSVKSNIVAHDGIAMQNNSSVGTCKFSGVVFRVDDFVSHNKRLFFFETKKN